MSRSRLMMGIVLAGMLALCNSARSEDVKAAVLDPDLLTGIEDKAPVRNADENPYEFRAYTHVLLQAHRTSPDAFRASARKDLTYAHLFEEPAKYRGQVVHLQGRLKRLRQFDAPISAKAEGVGVVYEGWIFDEVYFANPFCVLFTDLPSGIRIGEKVEYLVGFDGYFFKRYRYKAGDGWRDCPLLIGRTLRVFPQPVESGWSFSNAFLPVFLSLLILSGLLVVGLAWWFRQDDRRIRARIQQVRPDSFMNPAPESDTQ